MTNSPSVISVMTPFPVHAGPDTSLIAALAMMRGHDIRHLPVQRNGTVIGVVTESDLRMAEALTGSNEVEVSRLCTRLPLTVQTDMSIRQVVNEMATRGVDSAVVLRHGRLAGIVTLTDICEELLRHLPGPRFPPPDEHDGDAA